MSSENQDGIGEFRGGQVRALENYLERCYPDETIEITAITPENNGWRVLFYGEDVNCKLRGRIVFVTLRKFPHTDKLEDVKIDGEYPPDLD